MTQKEYIQKLKYRLHELGLAEAEACEGLREHLRSAVKLAGVPVGPLALALVGAEMAGQIIVSPERIIDLSAIQRAIEALDYRRRMIDRDLEITPENDSAYIAMKEGVEADREAIRSLNRMMRV